jgi:hypothetical protein
MRTTVTLDPDVAAQLRQLAKERGLSFKEVLNTTLRAGFTKGRAEAAPHRQRTYHMGQRPDIDLDKALRLAGALEDEAAVTKLELHK